MVAQLLADVGLPEASSEEQFRAALDSAAQATVRLGREQDDAQQVVDRVGHEKAQVQAESDELNAELLSLRSRRNNLPRENLGLRGNLCAELGIDAEELPFAGELIQVRPDEVAWEGAAERVLRAFGISLLVPEEHYRAVSDWIDGRHLGMRLVYFRVPHRVVSRPAPHPGSGELLHTKLQLHQDSPMYDWLEHELLHRAGLVCATTLEEFRRADRAVSQAGQIKDRQRHEKNDRHRIDDRSRYVLGWSNKAKIDVLLARATTVTATLQRLDDEAKAARERQAALQRREATLTMLAHHRSWEDIDWQSTVGVITSLESERRRVESSSGELARIAQTLREVEADQAGARR